MKLVGMAARHSDIACISSFDYIMQSLHGFGDRSVVVKAMTLKYVDIVELETLERVFDGLEYVLLCMGISTGVGHDK